MVPLIDFVDLGRRQFSMFQAFGFDPTFVFLIMILRCLILAMLSILDVPVFDFSDSIVDFPLFDSDVIDQSWILFILDCPVFDFCGFGLRGRSSIWI